MPATWLHISDLHIENQADNYRQDKVLAALVDSVRWFREHEGLSQHLIFVTGDVGRTGDAGEYTRATPFFDDMLAAAGLERRHLFVVPGNHDVDRGIGADLKRTLASGAESTGYFAPGREKVHLTKKQAAFWSWYRDYFHGVREPCLDSTCGPVELADADGLPVAVLPINTALFCQDDHDHEKLWVGRRCIEEAVRALKDVSAPVKVAMMHHPLEWVSGLERSSVRAQLRTAANIVLNGHRHENDFGVDARADGEGVMLSLQAGAAYDRSDWPFGAAYHSVEDGRLVVSPITYCNAPERVWRADLRPFPNAADGRGRFSLSHPGGVGGAMASLAPPAPSPGPAPLLSNIPPHPLPFLGRDDLLQDISRVLGEPGHYSVVALHGRSGAGKSELAREYARRQASRYPGGTFFVEAGGDGPPVGLAEIGRLHLGLTYPPGLDIAQQCQYALLRLGGRPVLLIYDGVVDPARLAGWLPPAGCPCHILITTVLDRPALPPDWLPLEVPPLPDAVSRDLVQELAGTEVAARFGEELVRVAGGLPIQLVPSSLSLKYEFERGHLDPAHIDLSPEAAGSFAGLFRRLEPLSRLLLQAAAFLAAVPLHQGDLLDPVVEGAVQGRSEIVRALDACRDVHILEGERDGPLRMHQLWARFVLDQPRAGGQEGQEIVGVRTAQFRRLLEIAREFATHPGDAGLAGRLAAFSGAPGDWEAAEVDIRVTAEGVVADALTEAGRYREALPWYQRAVEESEKGDIHGRVDHQSLGSSLHLVGYCYSQQGDYAGALPWYQRAVEEKEKGNIHGRVDYESLGGSLVAAAACLRRLCRAAEAS